MRPKLMSEPCLRCTCTVTYAARPSGSEGVTPLVGGIFPTTGEVSFSIVRETGGRLSFRPIVFCSSECAERGTERPA